jgi:hypothetical protein
MTTTAAQAGEGLERSLTPWEAVQLPTPSPGEILAHAILQGAEDRAVRLEASIGSAELAHAVALDVPDRKPEWRESGTFAGTPDVAALALTREVKSTSELYLRASARVRDAYAIQERLLTEAEHEARQAWSLAALRRAAKIEAKVSGVRRRIAALEACTQGKVCVHRFACPTCGQTHDSPPLTCNQRVCPACVPKLRAQNIAKVLELLDAVDDLRQKRGERTPRWRFVTLTVTSFDRFAPMRRFMAKAWGKLIRHRFWSRAVQASIACFETTHTKAGWHVHVHAIVDAFLPRDVLVRAWEKVTEGLGQAVGVHISEPKGTRASLARELAKYIAKDLGGAGSDGEEATSAWGVAGTAARLAEFLDGSFRWRTLRTYGDCYKVADKLKAAGALSCKECGVGLEYVGTAWLAPDELDEMRARRRARVPAQGSATPAAP